MAVKPLINEAELFASLAEGSETAFEEIYWHFTKRLHPYVMKMVHESYAYASSELSNETENSFNLKESSEPINEAQ